MKQILSICLLLSGLILHAQTDSVSTVRIEEDSLLLYNYQQAQYSAHWLYNRMPGKFNQLALMYQRIAGKYTTVQTPSSAENMVLSTEGKAILNKFHVWGRFNYSKTREDSTRWNHQSGYDPTIPYYFGSSAPIRYVRNLYKIDAMAGYRFWENKMAIGTGINYRIGQHFSTNDPRGSVLDYQLTIKPVVSYYGSKVSVGAGYIGGYGREEVNIAYKNPDYYESLIYPAYINYEMNGYGTARYWQLNRRSYTTIKRNGGMLSAGYKWKKAQIFLTAEVVDEKHLFFRRIEGHDIDISDYATKTKRVELSWQHTGKMFDKLISAVVMDKDGRDYYYDYKGNNYLYLGGDYRLKGVLQNKKSSSLWKSWMLETAYVTDERKDGLSGVHIMFEQLQLQVGNGMLFPMKKKQHVMQLNTSVGYTTTVNNLFVAPVQNENVFYKDVLYADYVYNNTAHWSAGLDIQYKMPLAVNMNVAFQLKAKYIHAPSLFELDRALITVPGNTRKQLQAALLFFF